MSRSDPQFNLRIPVQLKEQLEDEARKNKRSVTAEILDRLEASILMDTRIHDIRKDENIPISALDRIIEMSRVMSKLGESLKKEQK